MTIKEKLKQRFNNFKVAAYLTEDDLTKAGLSSEDIKVAVQDGLLGQAWEFFGEDQLDFEACDEVEKDRRIRDGKFFYPRTGRTYKVGPYDHAPFWWCTSKVWE